jgi:hypothetical protein
MRFAEMIGVYSENRMKHVRTLQEMREVFNVKAGSTHISRYVL